MSLSTDDVKKVARLARLAMSEAEIQAAHAQMSSIFGLIEEMQAVDTGGIEPMAHAQDLGQRLREDVVSETNQRNCSVCRPQVERGLYLVPRLSNKSASGEAIDFPAFSVNSRFQVY
jgi:aspartyl-tRNA(Asn)/glutamyl-tRNA(Gln) amidotransferase subunit C